MSESTSNIGSRNTVVHLLTIIVLLACLGRAERPDFVLQIAAGETLNFTAPTSGSSSEVLMIGAEGVAVGFSVGAPCEGQGDSASQAFWVRWARNATVGLSRLEFISESGDVSVTSFNITEPDTDAGRPGPNNDGPPSAIGLWCTGEGDQSIPAAQSTFAPCEGETSTAISAASATSATSATSDTTAAAGTTGPASTDSPTSTPSPTSAIGLTGTVTATSTLTATSTAVATSTASSPPVTGFTTSITPTSAGPYPASGPSQCPSPVFGLGPAMLPSGTETGSQSGLQSGPQAACAGPQPMSGTQAGSTGLPTPYSAGTGQACTCT
ncbi:hypothetical protein ANO11243_097150 [Dothideomycetidae sp. 11243]|nr:hypothetical protein ANO11243_097150 [fungal sp. No.11243]